MNKQELLDLKQEIEDSNSEIKRLEGRKEAFMEQLTELGIASQEEAQEQIKFLEDEIDIMDQQITEGTTKLETQLDERTGNFT